MTTRADESWFRARMPADTPPEMFPAWFGCICLAVWGPMDPPARCEWPGCEQDALCSSGNFGGKLVCREHFRITNG